MIDSMKMLDGLRERGFIPEEAEDGWFILPVSRYGVRAVLDQDGVTILMIGPGGHGAWYVSFADDAPLNIILGTLDLAIADAITRDARKSEKYLT
jgi:hypothetical protein